MDRPTLARRSTANRSAVTNGSRVLAGVDGRSAHARRFRDIVDELTAEIGRSLSAAETLQVRNAATLQMLSDSMAAGLARGEPVDPDAYTRAANGATRALSALRRLRPAKGRRERRTLDDVLAARRIAAE